MTCRCCLYRGYRSVLRVTLRPSHPIPACIHRQAVSNNPLKPNPGAIVCRSYKKPAVVGSNFTFSDADLTPECPLAWSQVRLSLSD